MGAKPDMFLDEDGNVIPFPERHTHGNAVGVPGTLKGLETPWKVGNPPLSKLIDPAIRLAEKGVKVNWVLADAIEENKEKLARTAAKDVFPPRRKTPEGRGSVGSEGSGQNPAPDSKTRNRRLLPGKSGRSDRPDRSGSTAAA